MECPNIEARLSEYLERSLPDLELARVAEHVHECRNCSGLLEEMRSILLACKSFPSLEPDIELLEKILLRTSGRRRTRSLREVISRYFLTPVLTPRFAAGAVLALLFMALSVGMFRSHIAPVASYLSPKQMLYRLDRGLQGIYAQGLKAYEKKNEWQAQFSFLKNNMFHKLGFMIEQLDVPIQTKDKQKSGEPRQQQEKAPDQKRSMLLLPA